MNLASIPIFPKSKSRDPRQQREMQQYVKQNKLISFQLAADDWLNQCPYNSGHFILDERFVRHQINCRAQYLKKCVRENKEPEIGICQWNGHHHFHKLELKKHEAECPDMAETVDRLAYFSRIGQEKEQKEREMKEKEERSAFQDVNGNATVNGAADVQPGPSEAGENLKEPKPKEEEESWDDELKRNPGQSYDPQAMLKYNRGRMIQEAPGITTKSERKKFRAEQAEIFEKKYKGDTTVLDNLGELPLEHQDFGLPEIDANRRRTLDLQKLQQAQRNAELSADHHSLESTRRRTVFAQDQLAAIMLQAKAEAEGTASTVSDSTTISQMTDKTE